MQTFYSCYVIKVATITVLILLATQARLKQLFVAFCKSRNDCGNIRINLFTPLLFHHKQQQQQQYLSLFISVKSLIVSC